MTNVSMEAICSPQNIVAAVQAVVRNKGAPGVDGMTFRELPVVLAARWPEIERTLLEGRYQPQPVRHDPEARGHWRACPWHTNRP